MAGARHGMCELAWHGMAEERHGHGMMCELDITQQYNRRCSWKTV